MTPIDHRLEIRYQVNPDNTVVAQVWTVVLSNNVESLRFASAPCLTKSDATQCALIFMRAYAVGSVTPPVDQTELSDLDARQKLARVKAVLETVLQHCEGKGWRSPDVAALVKSTIESL